jgi:hypothetical protein
MYSVAMKTLTVKQTEMLRDAMKALDGTVMAQGFSHSKHAVATGKALVSRGLLAFLKHSEYRGATIYRITDAGREAVTI